MYKTDYYSPKAPKHAKYEILVPVLPMTQLTNVYNTLKRKNKINVQTLGKVIEGNLRTSDSDTS